MDYKAACFNTISAVFYKRLKHKEVNLLQWIEKLLRETEIYIRVWENIAKVVQYMAFNILAMIKDQY